LRGPGVALGLVLLACGARTPLPRPDSVSSSASDDAGSDVTVVEDAPSASDVVEASMPPQPSDPCADMPPVPCPGGDFQYCVAGHYSECPKRCAACVPGSTRVCFLTYCNRWGTETCSADGLSFGFCKEAPIPSKCAAIADQYKTSPELEQCCIDSGFCCQDMFDLNGNGNYGDLIGTCNGTSC
jgi:hypothetical protein